MNQYQYPPDPRQGIPPQDQAFIPNGNTVGNCPNGGFAGNSPDWQGMAYQPASQQPAWDPAPQQVYPSAGNYSPVSYPAAGNWQQGAYPAAQPIGCPQPAGYTGYAQPCPQAVQPRPFYTPAYTPVAYSQPAYYAPPFAIKRERDPRLSGAAKTMNRMCLVVLLQTLAAIVFEIPLVGIMTVLGINVYANDMAFQWLTAVMVPLSTALPFFIYLKIGKRDVSEYLRFEKVGFVTALLCVLAGLGVCLLGNFPSIVVQNFFSNFGYEPASSLSGGDSGWAMFVLEFLTVAVLVPVMEEFAFRGVLLSSLKKYGTGFAIVASALVFSFVHLDFSNVVFAFIAGLVFGFLYAKTGNLWVTIFIHALNNGIAVIGTYGDFLFGEKLAEVIGSLLMLVPIVIGIAALVLLVIFKREKLFRRGADQPAAVRPLSAGESASSIVRAPLFWVVAAIMMAYTTTLFF